MAEPKDATELRSAFDTAFTWLAGKWEEDSEKTWTDLQRDFVAALDFPDAGDHPAVKGFVAHVDALSVSDEEDEQYDLLVDKEERDKVLDPLVDDWAETHRFIDDRWVVWHADKGEWLTKDGKPLDEEEPDEVAASTADESDEDAKRDDPAAVAGDLVEKVILPAIIDAIEDSPELAEYTPEERHALVTRLTREQLTKV